LVIKEQLQTTEEHYRQIEAFQENFEVGQEVHRRQSKGASLHL
ncbi:hypothetical protein T4D_3726, partial [Trichinella pseudospiralis]